MAVKVVMGKDANDVETLIKKWKTKVKKSGVLFECKKRMHFYTPAEMHKLKAKEARKNKK